MRRSIVVSLAIIAALAVAVLAVPLFLDANQFRPAIESQLSQSLGRKIYIGNLKLSVLSGTVTAQNLSVADDPAFGAAPFITAKDLVLSVGLWDAILHKRLNVRAIDIDAPSIVLTQAASGLWNFSAIGSARATPAAPAQSTPPAPTSGSGGNMALSIKSLKIAGARLTVNQGGTPRVLENVDIGMTNFSPSSVFPFTLTGQVAGGGELALNGKAGPIDQSNAANTPIDATIKLTKLNLRASGAVPAESGIDGLLSVDGNLVSKGGVAQIGGTIQAEKLKLAPGGSPAGNPVALDIDLVQDLTHRSGQLKRGDLATGGVKASLTGTWTQTGGTPVLQMSLSAPGVPVSGIEQLLPAAGIVLPSGSSLEGGTFTASLTIAGPPAALVVTGPVSLNNTRLKGFDAGSKLAPIAKLAGIQSGPDTAIQTASANLRLASGAVALQNIDVLVPSIGQLTGAGTISPAQTLDFHMRALVRAGSLISTNATTLGTSTGIPFSIDGNASNPQFHPEIGQLASQEIQQGLKGIKAGGADAGKAAGGVLQGIFGKKK